MRVWPIFKKEMRLYFTSPVAYAILLVFTVVMGLFFYLQFSTFAMASMQAMMNPMMARELNVSDAVMRPLFFNTLSVILFLFLMPVITMRLFAEEQEPPLVRPGGPHEGQGDARGEHREAEVASPVQELPDHPFHRRASRDLRLKNRARAVRLTK